jgi:hypothetical protein
MFSRLSMGVEERLFLKYEIQKSQKMKVTGDDHMMALKDGFIINQRENKLLRRRFL